MKYVYYIVLEIIVKRILYSLSEYVTGQSTHISLHTGPISLATHVKADLNTSVLLRPFILWGIVKRPTYCICLYQPCPESFSLCLLVGDCTVRIVVYMTVLLMIYCVMYNLGGELLCRCCMVHMFAFGME